MTDKPVILFACVHNSGRSVAAKVLTEHYGRDRVEVRSAGSEPGNTINPVVAEVLAERGLSVEGEAPKLLDTETVETSDVVVTMGCGETCPYFPGKQYRDWVVEDPEGQDLASVRRIVDDIDAKVQALIIELQNRL